MAFFDRLKKSSARLAIAVSAVLEGESGGITATIAKTATATPVNKKSEIPPQPESLREKIERMLTSGPRLYEEILAAVGGNEDDLREAIRNWPELNAYDKDGMWFWESRPAIGKVASIATDPCQWE